MENNKWSNKIIILTLCSLCIVFVTLLMGKNQHISQEIEAIDKKIEIENSEQVFEIWTINGGLETILGEVLEECKRDYPNVKFIIKAFKTEVYYEALVNAAATNALPDMFYTWGDKELQELVALDLVRDLTSVMQGKQLEDTLVNNALKSYTFNGRHYGIPVFGWNMVLYCNEELFDKSYLSYPKQYEDFLKTVEIFKSKGIVPLAISGDEAWMSSLYYMSLTLNEGSVSVSTEIAKDNVFFKRRPFVRGAELFKQLIDLKPWQEGYKDMSAVECTYNFVRGEAAMLVSGSWATTTIDDSIHSIIKGKVKVMPFPYTRIKLVDEGIAGYCDGFVLNKESDFKDIESFYFKVVKAISDKAVLEKGMGFPVYKSQDLERTHFETLKACYKLFPQNAYHSAYDKLLGLGARENYNNALLDFLTGSMDVEAFCNEIIKR